jgi:menaquinol-cytochrome c reductase iron-sulfur subunit
MTGPETGRRRFLKLASQVAGTLTALLAGFPPLVAFLSPAFRRREPTRWVRLGDSAAIDWGVPRKIDFVQAQTDAWVESRTLSSVWVYTDDGEQFLAYDPRCTHLGCGFDFSADAGVFVCPCHVGRFDPKSGAVLGGPPPRPLDRLETRVEDGVLFVAYRS